MASRGHQGTRDGSRLQGETRDLRHGLAKVAADSARFVSEIVIVGSRLAMPEGWHRANGQILTTKQYKRLADALGAGATEQTVQLPAYAVPAGLTAYIWGPRG